MTTQYSIARAISGQTGTSAKLFAVNGADTVLYTADSVTERTNALGQYLCEWGEASVIPAGDYTQILFSSGGIPLAIGDRTFLGVDSETATAAKPIVDVGAISGDATAADNAEAFFDGTGYAGTNNVIPTVTEVTNERGKYAMGAVWIGPAANTNTVSYVDGIVTNPVSTIAAAKTIADALNLRRFFTVRTGTSQLGADFVGYSFDGADWSLTTTGGSRDVSTSVFANANVVGGTFAATSGTIQWDHCRFDNGVSVGSSEMKDCLFGGTLTLNAAGSYDFIDCASDVPGATAPVFALSTGAMNVGFRRWSGGITFSGITADDVLTISGELGTIDLGSPSGAADVQIRGTYKAITNVGSAVVNLEGAILAADVASILADTNELQTNQGDWLTATGFSTLTAGQVNAEVLDVLNVDTFAEETGVPAATSSLRKKIGWMFMWFRNRVTQTGTTSTLYADDGTTPVGTHPVSDDATTFESGEGA